MICTILERSYSYGIAGGRGERSGLEGLPAPLGPGGGDHPHRQGLGGQALPPPAADRGAGAWDAG